MEQSNTDLASLQRELNNALALIERSNIAKGYDDSMESQQLSISETSSLLERCREAVGKSPQKPVLRLLHHFACSGGTLISKCIAAQPNVYLLSELHPYSELWKPKKSVPFAPSDILGQARHANIPKYFSLASQIFIQSLSSVEKHLSSLGAILVVRLHTHSEFCVGDQCPQSDTVLTALEDYFEVLNVVTVRDPVDAYYSLQLNGWIHFNPPTFNEYCRRLLTFLSQYPSESIFFYEDFVDNPDKEIVSISGRLNIPYSDLYGEIFDAFNVSGNSGRSGNKIEPRKRREMPDEYLKETEKSYFYKQYKELMSSIKEDRQG